VLFSSLDTNNDGGIAEGTEFAAAFGSGPSPPSARLLQLPDGWGDDEIYTWFIGREETDVVSITRGPSFFYSSFYNSASLGQTETRDIIHPKKFLMLRLPGIAALAAAQTPPTDASAYHTQSFKITVEACACVELVSNCQNNDCTTLGTVETNNAGGFQLSSCFSDSDSPAQPRGLSSVTTGEGLGIIPGSKGNCLGYTDSGDLEFVAYHDGFRVTLETRKTWSYSDEPEYLSNAALPELGVVTTEDCDNTRAVCRLETSALLDVTHLRGNNGELRSLSSDSISSGDAPWLPVKTNNEEVLISGEKKSWS
jgi:hypothetical protein